MNYDRFEICKESECQNLTLDTWPYCFEHTTTKENVSLHHTELGFALYTEKHLEKHTLLDFNYTGICYEYDDDMMNNDMIKVSKSSNLCLSTKDNNVRYTNGHLIAHNDFYKPNCEVGIFCDDDIDDETYWEKYETDNNKYYINIRTTKTIPQYTELMIDYGEHYSMMLWVLNNVGIKELMSYRPPNIIPNVRFNMNVRLPEVCQESNEWDHFWNAIVYHLDQYVNFYKHINQIVTARCFVYAHMIKSKYPTDGIDINFLTGDVFRSGRQIFNLDDIDYEPDTWEY